MDLLRALGMGLDIQRIFLNTETTRFSRGLRDDGERLAILMKRELVSRKRLASSKPSHSSDLSDRVPLGRVHDDA